MFDIATRQAPSSSQYGALAVPFDWRLTPPAPPTDFPWTNFQTVTGQPDAHVDVLATYALALEDTFQTAVIISLFTDARAGEDDALPLGVTDRRGWVGDEYMADSLDAVPDPWGSLFWLIYSGKADSNTLQRAKFYGNKALQWMVDAGVASKIETDAVWYPTADGDRLAIRPQIYKPGQAQPVYDVLWGTTIWRGALT